MSAQPTTTPPAPNAATVVAAAIRKQIVMGELAEGDLLPSEAEMLKQLKVSRPTLRQAFRILEAEHLITVQRGSRGGTTVHRPSGRLAARYLGDLLQYRRVPLGDVFRARLMIEPAAVAQLARSRDEAAIAELTKIVAAQRLPNQSASSIAGLEEAFHVRLVELAGNVTLAEYGKLVHYLISGCLDCNSGVSSLVDVIDAHERLVHLLSAGAVHAATEHWRQHLDAVRDVVAEKYDMDGLLNLVP